MRGANHHHHHHPRHHQWHHQQGINSSEIIVAIDTRIDWQESKEYVQLLHATILLLYVMLQLPDIIIFRR